MKKMVHLVSPWQMGYTLVEKKVSPVNLCLVENLALLLISCCNRFPVPLTTRPCHPSIARWCWYWWPGALIFLVWPFNSCPYCSCAHHRRVTMVFKIQMKKEQTFLIAVKFMVCHTSVTNSSKCFSPPLYIISQVGLKSLFGLLHVTFGHAVKLN